MYAVFAVETAATRRTQLITGNTDLELCFDDLFGDITANLDHTFVVGFTGFRHTQHVLARRKRSQDYTT